MNYAQLEALVSRITYKPGYRITARFDGIQEQVVLHLVADHPDATGSVEGEIPIVCTSYISGHHFFMARAKPADILLVHVADMIRDHELHEMYEWLKIDGKHYRDPHPKPS